MNVNFNYQTWNFERKLCVKMSSLIFKTWVPYGPIWEKLAIKLFFVLSCHFFPIALGRIKWIELCTEIAIFSISIYGLTLFSPFWPEIVILYVLLMLKQLFYTTTNQQTHSIQHTAQTINVAASYTHINIIRYDTLQ